MKTSFENLYMSHSMHDVFNKQVLPSAEEILALNLFAPKAKPEAFTLEAMIAAADSYSVNASDLSQYTQH